MRLYVGAQRLACHLLEGLAGPVDGSAIVPALAGWELDGGGEPVEGPIIAVCSAPYSFGPLLEVGIWSVVAETGSMSEQVPESLLVQAVRCLCPQACYIETGILPECNRFHIVLEDRLVPVESF